MIDHQSRRIHVHIPKTGGTSLRSVLIPDAGETRHEIASDFPVDEWDGYFTFAFVRNPFDRLVSSYAYHTARRYSGVLARTNPDLKGLSFAEYVERFVVNAPNPQFISQTQYVVHDVSSVPIDFIGRFEHLNSDYNRLTATLGVDAPVLPHRLKSKHAHYSQYYDSRTRDIAECAYESDLYAFGYTFEVA